MTMYDQYLLAVQTRREMLRRAGLTALTIGAAPTMLAACGSDDDEEEAAAPKKKPAAEAKAPPASGRIDFLSWEGYDIPKPMKAFKQANSVKVKANYIGNHDDIQAKLIAAKGAKGFDLITYYQGYKPLYKELKILEPLDEAKLPNLKNLFPYFASKQGNFWIDPDGSRTGVPWTWGSIGITYDSAETDELASWYDLLDPKFKGKIAMVDDPAGAYTLASHILGLDPSKVTKADNEKVKDLLQKMRAQAKSVSPSFGDMTTKLVSGDAVACFQGWAAMNTFAVDAGKKTVKTNLPKEGSFSFCDAYAVPPTADNVDTVHAWMNESMDPKVNAAAAEALVGGVTVQGAVDHLDKAVADLYPYEDIEGLLEKAPFYNNPPVKSDEFFTFNEMIQQWQEIKAGT
jgi:spermidine/putrescine transport system substrate-binding protein